MFFRATNGHTFPVAAITKMETPYRENGEPIPDIFSKVIVWLGEDKFVEAYRHEVDKLYELPITSFSAPPGTFLLSYADGEIETQPIIGWVVSQGKVSPALVHGVFDDPEESWFVLTPDGSVNDEHGNHWPDVHGYRAYCEHKERTGG